MTIHVPKPLAIALGVLLGGGLLFVLRDEGRRCGATRSSRACDSARR